MWRRWGSLYNVTWCTGVFGLPAEWLARTLPKKVRRQKGRDGWQLLLQPRILKQLSQIQGGEPTEDHNKVQIPILQPSTAEVNEEWRVQWTTYSVVGPLDWPASSIVASSEKITGGPTMRTNSTPTHIDAVDDHLMQRITIVWSNDSLGGRWLTCWHLLLAICKLWEILLATMMHYTQPRQNIHLPQFTWCQSYSKPYDATCFWQPMAHFGDWQCNHNDVCVWTPPIAGQFLTIHVVAAHCWQHVDILTLIQWSYTYGRMHEWRPAITNGCYEGCNRHWFYIFNIHGWWLVLMFLYDDGLQRAASSGDKDFLT